jgi:hypothetical protein
VMCLDHHRFSDGKAESNTFGLRYTNSWMKLGMSVPFPACFSPQASQVIPNRHGLLSASASNLQQGAAEVEDPVPHRQALLDGGEGDIERVHVDRVHAAEAKTGDEGSETQEISDHKAVCL